MTRLRAAAAGEDELEARTAVVLAHAGPARLLEVLADKPHRQAKRRIAEATRATPVALAVKKAVARTGSD